ncbi:alpha/beta-Hydrolases superfamily protein [Prunus dulcis]|uniref:Alpha/beta-Hydrolases superfamily protein n=1 Tax=Prunus dulcis TaxID=3755 RepID=A0A4Y1R4J2_PRUDU|nr:alpha/beta-Hydrolases superfamily protein [Prunus dulcis]
MHFVFPLKQKLHLKKSWGMPVLFLSSVVFALGHTVVAYRTSCRARRKLMFHRVDPEAVLSCKNVFSGYQKVPRSPTPSGGKTPKSDSEMRRKPFSTARDEGELQSDPWVWGRSLLMEACDGTLARQVGCTVAAFDRPGWGLTSRLRREDWEDKEMPNPYTLESQVDLLLSFCSDDGFSSVVLVGHDDGGLLALMAAQKVQASVNSFNVTIKGVVLLNVSLSREVVPAFARILLRTSLGKKHLVRPLLRTEITQVVNRRAWYDATKLTMDAPLCVEGWDEALHEIGRLSYETFLSPKNAESLLKAVEGMPVLVIAGAEDALVSLKSSQAMASKLQFSPKEESKFGALPIPTFFRVLELITLLVIPSQGD